MNVKGAAPAMGPAEWLMLVALAALWGGSYAFNHVAVEDLPPLTVVLGRVGLAAAVLNVVLRPTGASLPRALRAWGSFLVTGALANAVPFGLIVWGQTRIAGGLASILNATTPLCTIFVAHLVTHDERLRAHRLVGVLLGFAGVVVIGPGALLGLGGDAGTLAAQLALLAAALSYALGRLYGRRFRGLSPLVPATGQVTALTLLLAPVVALVVRPWTIDVTGPAAIGAVVGLALLCTATAHVLFFRILGTAGATNPRLVAFLIPIGALALGTTLLGERVEPRQLVEMVVIFVGLAVIDGRLPKALSGSIGRRLVPARSGA